MGLIAKKWHDEMSHDNPSFNKLEVGINAFGTFNELGRATEYKSLLRNNSSAANVVWPNRSDLAGSSFVLGDVLSRLPTL